MSALCASHRWFVTVTDNNKEIDVTSRVRFSPGIRAKQPYFLGMKFCLKTPRDLREQVLTDDLHERRVMQFGPGCKSDSAPCPPPYCDAPASERATLSGIIKEQLRLRAHSDSNTAP